MTFDTRTDEGLAQTYQGDRQGDLTDVYELLEEMTPPEVRLARQLLGEMHQLWEGIVKHEERLLAMEDRVAEIGLKMKRVAILEGALEETIRNVQALKDSARRPRRRTLTGKGTVDKDPAAV